MGTDLGKEGAWYTVYRLGTNDFISSKQWGALNHEIGQTSTFYSTEGIWQSRGKVRHSRPSRDYFKSLK